MNFVAPKADRRNAPTRFDSLPYPYASMMALMVIDDLAASDTLRKTKVMHARPQNEVMLLIEE